MKLKDILNEKIELDVEIGDTILVGRFKNKKLVVKDIGKDSHGMPTINGRKVTTFRTMKKDEAVDEASDFKKAHKKFKETGELPPHLKKLVKDLNKVKVKHKVKNVVVPGLEWMSDIDEGTCGYSIDGEGDDEPAGPHLLKKESKEQIKVIHDFLTKYTKSAKKASAMIKKNYKKVKKQFRGDSTRDLAMAIIGYDVIGEGKQDIDKLYALYSQAMQMVPNSPQQKKLKTKIKALRKKLKMDESIIKEMSPEKRAFLMLRIYGDSWKVNLGKVFSGINKQKPGMIKKGLKEIKILNKKIEDMIEDLV